MERDLYSRAFCFEHTSGDLLFPVRLRSRLTGQATFRVWELDKSDEKEMDEREMMQSALERDFAVRMSTLDRRRHGGYRASGHSVVAVKKGAECNCG